MHSYGFIGPNYFQFLARTRLPQSTKAHHNRTEFINLKESDKPVLELIKETTSGLGVDYCYECTGVPELLNEAIEGSEVGLGTVVFIDARLHLSGELKYIPLFCGRTIKGSIYGGVRPQTDLLKIVEKCINKVVGCGD
ncbi:alcohol dehydrogenase [Olea europaea subsp. europaea]|uniref:Alcohol dehydrogenase, partial n=1 Tax=Olea europaea subsp. europaea TaxID=158383 RepID=A0A8S0T513_OLEEU|nr:alcohol dehydrogenase [Olea europaea subsp. europaea]